MPHSNELTQNPVDLLFNPRSVAVIGASTNPVKGGHRILKNLIEHGFNENLFPINPKGGSAYGIPFYKSVLDVEEDIDVGIVFVPNKVIPDVIEQCIEKGIKGLIIQAAGFEEVGKQGLELRDKIREITDNFQKIRIVGPNCTGLTRVDDDGKGFYSAFIVQQPAKKGNIAVISQSGMINGGYFIHLCTHYPEMGFRYVASIGNKMDLNEIDFMEYFLQDQTVNVIAIYLESFQEPREFIRIAREAAKLTDKKIILLRGGLTSQGQNASTSHTGALAENIVLSKALISQSKVIQVDDFYGLFQAARIQSMVHKSGTLLPVKGDIAFVTVSGGAGTVSTDLIQNYGLTLPALGQQCYSKLQEIFPTWMPPNKFSLIDLWPAIENAKVDSDGIHRIALDALLQDDGIEGLLISIFYTADFPFSLKIIEDFRRKYNKPIFCWVFGEKNKVDEVKARLTKKNIPCFRSLESMVKNFSLIVKQSSKL